MDEEWQVANVLQYMYKILFSHALNNSSPHPTKLHFCLPPPPSHLGHTAVYNRHTEYRLFNGVTKS